MIGKRTAFPFATEPIDASSKLGSGSAFVRQDVGQGFSIAVSHFPSGARRKTTAPRPLIAMAVPSGPVPLNDHLVQ